MLDSLLHLISGSRWTYLFVFGIAVLDAVVPIVPAEAAVITAGRAVTHHPSRSAA